MRLSWRSFIVAIFVAGVFLALKTPIYAQSSTYTATVQNQTVLSGSVFQFDVYVLRTGSTSWRMADATFQLTFNSSAFTGLSIEFVGGSTGLASGYTISPEVNTTRINIDILSPTTYSASTEISASGNGTRIGTFKVSTISNSSASMNMAWRTPLSTYQAVNERETNDDQNLITSGGTYTNPPNAPLSSGGTAPSAPTLSSPANGAPNQPTSLTLSWNASSGATSYRLQVSTSSLFTTTVVDDSSLAGTSRVVSGLTNSTIYYWRVNAKNTSGTSAYSTTWSFTTASGVVPPVAPLLVSPADGTTGVLINVTLRWNSSPGATSYGLQVSEDQNFASFTLNLTGITDTSRSSIPLVNNTTYYWRVNASNSAGPSTYSTTWSFATIVSAPATPTPVSPSEGAVGVSTAPTLSWNPSTGATSYRLQVATNAGFSPILVDDTSLTGTSKQIGPLANNTTHYWRVNAKNDGGMSLFSSVRSFTTILAAPTLVSPSNGAVDVSRNPTLSWNPSAGATSYHLQVRTPQGTVVDDSTITGTSRAVTGLAVTTEYSWRVRAKNAAGTSDWSGTWTFTTVPAAPAAPSLVLPAPGATGVSTNPTLSWSASSGATSYRLQVSSSSAFTTPVVDDSTLNTTSKEVGPLANSTTYYWRVSAKNAGGSSAFSSSRSFTTSAPVSVVRDEGVLPREFHLYPNYPNPFNPSTTITYDLAARSFVSLKVYNVLMQEVAILVSEEQPPGRYRARFDSGELTSGLYFYQITAGPFKAVKKMILLK